jgi:hypothetical protein
MTIEAIRDRIRSTPSNQMTADDKYAERILLLTDVATLKRHMTAAQEELAHLTSYLLSAKFHQDSTVQVTDVLNRLQEVRSLLMPIQTLYD